MIFSLMTPQSDIPQSVNYFSTGCEDMLLALQESGIYVYCFDAVNAMRILFTHYFMVSRPGCNGMNCRYSILKRT